MKNNYYEWLELKVTEYNYDVKMLTEHLDKYITKWNSSKNHDVQRRVELDVPKIKEAINDEQEWKKIYEEYKREVDSKIIVSAGIHDNNISDEALKNTTVLRVCYGQDANLTQTDIDYVKDIMKKVGCTFTGTTAGKAPNVPTGKKLSDYKPVSQIENMLKSGQKALKQLAYDNLFDYLNSEIECGITEKSPKDEILGAIGDIREAWKHNKRNLSKKTLVDTISTAFESFFRNNDVPVYIEYLNYEKLHACLQSIFTETKSNGVTSIPERAFGNYVNDVYSITGNAQDAESVLKNYLDEKNVAYPRPISDTTLCPFCTMFVKRKPLPDACSICHKSLLINCPKCGKSHNLLESSTCCGVDLQRYPVLIKQIDEVEKTRNSGKLSLALKQLEDINNEWPGISKAAKLLSETKGLYKDCQDEMSKIENYRREKKYFTASRQIPALSSKLPNAKEMYQDIQDVIENAKKQMTSFEKETDPSKKEIILLGIFENIVDYPDALAKIVNYPCKNVTNLTVECNTGAKGMTISWSSSNTTQHVVYHIRRKVGSPINNISDGEEVEETPNLSFCDTDARSYEGEPLFYAVYATKGPNQSNLCSTKTPSFYFEKLSVSAIPRESAIEVTWTTQGVKGLIQGFISTSVLKGNAQGGKAITGISPQGVTIEQLNNGQQYYMMFCKVAEYSGNQYQSEWTYVNATPIEKIIVPKLLKKIGKKPGEYILETEGKQIPGFSIYCSNTRIPNVEENTNSDFNSFQVKYRKLITTVTEGEKQTVQLKENETIFAIPVVVRSGTVSIGRQLELAYVQPLVITQQMVAGTDIVLKIDSWPSNYRSIKILCSTEAYPTSRDDSDKVTSVTKDAYERDHLIRVRNIENKTYFITIQALLNTDATEITVANCKVENAVEMTIRYCFNVSAFKKKITVSVDCDKDNCPELILVVGKNSVPIRKNDSASVFTCTIPPQTVGQFDFAVSGFSASEKNLYAKLFSSVAGPQLICNGGNKIT